MLTEDSREDSQERDHNEEKTEYDDLPKHLDSQFHTIREEIQNQTKDIKIDLAILNQRLLGMEGKLKELEQMGNTNKQAQKGLQNRGIGGQIDRTGGLEQLEN
ncbi:Hypothetical predicted protein [Pelobates cultripes]|uniref:Uncharacterized protein n=1 Tax=Pelobates cultripes TaxID=61616 RepID=A0AAD1SCK7_PELCU|nr:Hypothetical predicted protein [Pelobates cultripes]